MLSFLIRIYKVILKAHAFRHFLKYILNCQIINKCIIFLATPTYALWCSEKKVESQIGSAMSFWLYGGRGSIYT